MSFDPFAVRQILPQLAAFVELLADELRARRAPLETALRDLLLAWDVQPGRHELAARLDAVGVAVRAAGLADEVRRMCGVRTANVKALTGNEVTVALALLDAATGDDAKRAADLLDRLLDVHHDLVPGVRASLARVAEQLLVVWCDRHATDYRARFLNEVRRLDLDLHLVEQWDLDHDTDRTDAAALVLNRLLDGERFALGWLDEVPSLDGETDEITNEVNADEVSVEITKQVKPRGIPRKEAEARVETWLNSHGYPARDPMSISVRQVAVETGLPGPSSVGRLDAWKKFVAWRREERSSAIRTRSLDADMLAVIPNRTAEDPADIASANEEEQEEQTTLERLLVHAKTDLDRARFRGMDHWDREALLEGYGDLGRDEADCPLKPARRERSRCS